MTLFKQNLKKLLHTLLGLIIVSLCLPPTSLAERSHGLSLGGGLKYPAGFKHFDYADPNAYQGGVVNISDQGSFNKLNPYSNKGLYPLHVALLFDTLTTQSLDEPFSEYGLLAEAMEVAEDGLSVTFYLRPEAKFSDGKPVTAEDAAFSLEVLRSKEANPLYQYYYGEIKKAEVIDERTIKFIFAEFNPELAMITGQLPVLPKHFFAGKDFGKDFNTQLLGSGPYLIKDYEFGKYIRYVKNKNYWGQNINVNVGQNNFEEIVVKYYKDATARTEGLKAGEFDIMDVYSSKKWAVDIAGEKWDKGYLVKEMMKHENTAGMQGFSFNLRLPLFQNRDVRHALALAMDFEWMNKTLFYNQYRQQDSFFDNSELAATGLPTDAEKVLLEPYKDQIPPEVFTKPMGSTLGSAYETMRAQLRAAKGLLTKAGWEVQDGVLTEKKTGLKMKFTILLGQAGFQRIVEPYIANLKKLGMDVSMKLVDRSIYEKQVRTFDFDVVTGLFPQSQSPGNEQVEFWGSDAADREGSRNLVGIKNPAVDAMIKYIIRAPSRPELLTAVHALDRILWHEHYVAPQWFIGHHRITYWNKFEYPETLPLYFIPTTHFMFWSISPEKEKELNAAMAEKRPVKN